MIGHSLDLDQVCCALKLLMCLVWFGFLSACIRTLILVVIVYDMGLAILSLQSLTKHCTSVVVVLFMIRSTELCFLLIQVSLIFPILIRRVSSVK